MGGASGPADGAPGSGNGDDAQQQQPARERIQFRREAIEANASWDDLAEPLLIARRSVVRSLLAAIGRAVALIVSGGARAVSGRNKVRFVPQVESADCGAACLAMVLGHFGIDVDMARLRAMTGASRDGVTARAMVTTARSFGLQARGVRTDVAGLDNLPTPAILHWNLSHFVVLDAVRRGGATIVDPAVGPRDAGRDEIGRSFSGVALVFERPPSGTSDVAATATDRPWRLLRGFTRPRRRWIGVLALSLLIQVAALIVPLVTRVLVDRAVPTRDLSVLRWLAIAAIPFVAAWFVVSALRTTSLVRLQAHLDYALVSELVGHLLDLPYAFFQARSAGDLLMRIRSSTVVREIFTTSTVSGLLDGTMAVVALSAVVAVDWRIGLVLTGVALLQAIVLVATWVPYRSLAAEKLEAQARSHGVLMETLTGIETLKLTGAARRRAEAWSNFFAREVNLDIRRGTLDATSESLVAALRTLAPVAALLYGSYLVLDGSMSLGDMIAVATLATVFVTPVASLVPTILRLSLLYGYLHRMQDILSTPREQDLGHVTPLESFRGSVTVEAVSHRYGPTSPLVLEDISFVVEPGSAIGIVGASGSGKSTLAMIVAGLHVPTSGRVLFDGQDVATTDLDSLRRQIAVVSQQSYIFAGTIRSNIALGDAEVGLDAIVDAAKAACIHDEIMAMPMRYETMVSDGGSTVSGGQRQRIALARAFLRNPVLLVLDEATSALDSVVEAEIFRNVRARGTTRIVVAHRLSTVSDSDRIIVMHEGRAVEVGDHETLLATGSRYAELYRMQDALATTGVDGTVTGSAFAGAVTLERVSHRYAPSAPDVVEDVSLEVRPGEVVGIVGGPRSGKTTIAMIAAAVHAPTGGRVLFDGRVVAPEDLERVRAGIELVGRRSFVAAGTIRSNITMGRTGADHDAVVEAATAACLHDDVMAMPMQYDTMLSEGGFTLWATERQRLCLARAMLGRPSLLVLDEATSALDAATEAQVMANARARGAGLVVVTRRLAALEGADRILVLDGGRAVEVGDHETLLARGERYAELAAAAER